jgi:predicted permease
LVHVSPRYFATMGMRIVAGRTIDETDRKESPQVVLLSRTTAREFFGTENAVGRVVSFARVFDSAITARVVGVVDDVRFANAREDFGVLVFVPLTQQPAPITTVAVRTSGNPAALAGSVRAVLKQLDPTLTVGDALLYRTIIESSLRQERMLAILSTAFGLLALLLAAIGLYGVIAGSVARRTQEMGIRLALGAQSRQVLALILREVFLLLALGLSLGLVATLAATRTLRSLLFGLPPHDAVTLAACVAALTLVALLAGYLPARAASALDPMTALRRE